MYSGGSGQFGAPSTNESTPSGGGSGGVGSKASGGGGGGASTSSTASSVYPGVCLGTVAGGGGGSGGDNSNANGASGGNGGVAEDYQPQKLCYGLPGTSIENIIGSGFYAENHWNNTYEDLEMATVKLTGYNSSIYNTKPHQNKDIEVIGAVSGAKLTGVSWSYANNINANRTGSIPKAGAGTNNEVDPQKPSPSVTISSNGTNSNLIANASRMVPFNIYQAPVNKVKIADIDSYEYNNTNHAPSPRVTFTPEGESTTLTLVEGKDRDYTVSISDNINAGQGLIKIEPTKKSNFSGEVYKQFFINPRSMKDSVIQVKSNPVYTSKPQGVNFKDPQQSSPGSTNDIITVLDVPDGITQQTLKLGKDFELYDSYQFTDAGTYRVKIRGIGNYNGENEFDFKIDPLTIKTGTSVDSISERTFNGESHVPRPNLYHNHGTQDYTRLVKDKDYTVSYSNNVTVGKDTASVVFNGRGNYTGSIAKSFSISARDLIVSPKAGQSFVYGTPMENLVPEYVYEGAAKNYLPTFSGKLKINWGENPTVPPSAGEYDILHDDRNDDHLRLDSSNLVNKNYTFKYVNSQEVKFIIHQIPEINVPPVSISGQKSNDWYISEVTLIAPDNYLIYDSNTKTYLPSIKISSGGIYEGSNAYNYTLKRVIDGAIVAPKSISFKQDMVSPTFSEVVNLKDSATATDRAEIEARININNLGPASKLETKGSIEVQVKKQDSASRWETLTVNADENSENTLRALYNTTSNGTYVFKITNAAGLYSEKSIQINNIDNVVPLVKVDVTLESGGQYQGNSWVNENLVVRFKNQANNLGKTTYMLQDGAGGSYKAVEPNNGDYYKLIHDISEKPGEYMYKIKLISEAKKESEEYILNVKGNVISPSVSIDMGDHKWDGLRDSIQFKLFMKESQQINITSTSPVPISKTEYYTLAGEENGNISSPPLTELEIEKIVANNWKKGSLINSLSANRKYVIYAKVTDVSNNVSYACTEGIVIDNKGPTFLASYPYNGIWTYDTKEAKRVAIQVKDLQDNLSGIRDIFYKISSRKGQVNDATPNNLEIKDNIAQIAFEDGESYVKIIVNDNTGNVTESGILDIKKDQVNPTIDVDVDDSTWQPNKDVTVSVSVGPSGVKYVQIKEENDINWTTLSPTSENIYKYTIESNGTYNFRMENNAGNLTEVQKVITKIDKGRPAVSLRATVNGNALMPYSSDTWTNQSVYLEFSNMTEGIDIQKYQYKKDDGEYNTVNPESNGVCSLVVSEDGQNTFTFKVTAQDGTESDEISIKVKRSTVAPTGSIQVGDNQWNSISGSQVSDIFLNNEQAILIENQSSESGIAKMEYFVKSGEEDAIITGSPGTSQGIENEVGSKWSPVTNEVPSLSPNRQHVVYAKMEDNAGNKLYLSTDIITIDNKSPTFRAEFSDDNRWIDNATITISDILDNLSGVKTLKYQIDELDPHEISIEDISSPVVLDYLKDGDYNIKIIATDYSGNPNISNIFRVKQDSVKPTLNIQVDDEQPEIVKNIFITPNVGPSGVSSVQLLDHNSNQWENVQEPKSGNPYMYVAKLNGTYRVKVTNNAGITSDEYEVTLNNVQSKKPIVDVVADSHESSYEEGQWTNNDVVIKLGDHAQNQGRSSYYYKINDGEYKQIYPNEDGTYLIKDDLGNGIHVYTFKIINEVGIESAEKTFVIKKDADPPAAKISVLGNEWDTIQDQIEFNHYFNEGQKVHITGLDHDRYSGDVRSRTIDLYSNENVEDDKDIYENNSADRDSKDDGQEDPENQTQSGVEKMEYFILSGEELEKVKNDFPSADKGIEDLVNGRWKEGEELELDTNDRYIIYARATDRAGNISYVNTSGIVIDSDKPEVSIVYPNDGIWTPKASVKIEIPPFDLSGIKSASYVLDNSSPKELDISGETITLDNFEDGEHELFVTVEDNAGNVNSTGTISIKQDSVKPSIKVDSNQNESYETEKIVFISTNTGPSGLKNIKVQHDSDIWEEINLDNQNGVYNYMAKDNGIYKFRAESNAGLISIDVEKTFEKIDSPTYKDSNTSTFLKEGDYRASIYIGIMGAIISSTLAMVYVSKRGRGKNRKKK